MNQEKEKLQKLLSQLALRVQTLVTEGKFGPGQRVPTRLRFSGFSYEQGGPKYDSGWLEETLEPHWPNAVWDEIMNSLLGTDEYQAAATAVLKCPGGEKNLNYFKIFTGRLLSGMLPSKSIGPELPSDFIKFLYGEPRKHTLTAQLDGLLVFSQEVVVSHGTDSFILRQATQEDAERVVGQCHPQQDRLAPAPAILNIVAWASENVPITMLNLLLKTLAILRLFGLGSVAYRSYTEILSLFSMPSVHTTYGPHDALSAPYKYKIDVQNINRLAAFWANMCEVIPVTLYSVTETDGHYLRVAYERYSESILSNRPWESKIMMASMALESLFLPENNEAELNYRLTTFASKVLGMLGLDSIQARKRLKRAYRFRSKYVHGGQLSPEQKRRAWENEDIDQFTRTVLDYVRICLLAFIYLNTKKTKAELMELIDSSLISEEAHEQLQELLAEVKKTLGLCIFSQELFEEV